MKEDTTMTRKLITIALMAVLCLSLAACAQESRQAPAQESAAVQSSSAEVSSPEKTGAESQAQMERENRVAKDGADMQTEDTSMPTRIPMEGGTKINLYFGDTVIPGVLNDSETAKALIEKLPMTQHMSRYTHDFCGVTEELPYNEEEVHYGWLNGDNDYAIDAPYFTLPV
jgi:hypothetical protein